MENWKPLYKKGCRACGNGKHKESECKSGDLDTIINKNGATLGEWKETRYRGKLDNFDPPIKSKEEKNAPYEPK
jgi:hypothetical protein